MYYDLLASRLTYGALAALLAVYFIIYSQCDKWRIVIGMQVDLHNALDSVDHIFSLKPAN